MRVRLILSKIDRNALLVLLILFSLFAIYLSFKNSGSHPNNTELITSALYSKDTAPNNRNDTSIIVDEKSSYTQLKNFDPNKIELNDWINLGFSEKQSMSIISYKNSINGFKSKSDLKKVYVISEEKYLELEPFIQISLNDVNTEEEVTPTSKALVELNNATSQDLLPIYGIGEKLAERIIKYRNKLGGFHSSSQLNEVYGLSEETLVELKSRTTINPNAITKININKASKDELMKNIYLNFEAVSLILKKRDQQKLKDINFLKDLIDPKKLEHLAPYIIYE